MRHIDSVRASSTERTRLEALQFGTAYRATAPIIQIFRERKMHAARTTPVRAAEPIGFTAIFRGESDNDVDAI